MRVFKEEQRFTQLWLIVIMIISMVMPLAVILKEADSMSSLELIIAISVILLVPALIFIFKLSTRIDEKGIHYKFFPFHLKFKTIPWENMAKAYVRKYDALSEYGGWGLKGGLFWKKSKGTAVNINGDIGIQLELKDGKKLLIGTQKENDAKNIIETYQSKIKIASDENN